MGVHGDDIVLTIRAALAGESEDAGVVSAQAPTQSEVRITAGDGPWANRDGKLEFDVVGRDWFRAFRITVEALPVEDFKGEMGSNEWVVSE